LNPSSFFVERDKLLKASLKYFEDTVSKLFIAVVIVAKLFEIQYCIIKWKQAFSQEKCKKAVLITTLLD